MYALGKAKLKEATRQTLHPICGKAQRRRSFEDGIAALH
jgi:hypothetical protein